MIKIPKLVCDICKSELEVPRCCNQSMMLKDDYLLCCCSDNCSYQSVPECCGQKMTYIDI